MATLRIIGTQKVWENGRIGLTKDLIFGLCVMTERGWTPVDSMSTEDQEIVQREAWADSQFMPEEIAAALQKREPRKQVFALN